MLNHRGSHLMVVIVVVVMMMVMVMMMIVMTIVVVGMHSGCRTLDISADILLRVSAQVSTGSTLFRTQLPRRRLLPGFLAFLQRTYRSTSTTHVTVRHVLQLFLLFRAQIGKVQQLHRDLVTRLGKIHLLGTDLVKVLVDPDRR